MFFTIKNENLINILKIVSGGLYKTPSKNKDTLINILLRIINDKIFCISTNNDIEIIVQEELNDKKRNGEIIISYNFLYNICRTCSSNSYINIIVDKKKIKINCEDSNYTISRNTYKTIPIIKNKNIKIHASIYSHELKNLCKKVKFSIADNDTRSFLNGVFLELTNSQLLAISSDGYRLSSDYIKTHKYNSYNFQTVISKTLVQTLINICPDNDLMHIYKAENYIKIFSNKLSVTSRLIEGIYPDCKNLLKYNKKHSILIDTQKLQKTLIKTKILYDINYHTTKILIKNTYIKITTSNMNEEITTVINLNKNYHLTAVLNINIIFLASIAQVIQSKNTALIFDNPHGPIILKETDDNNGIYLVMPLKT